MSYYIDLREFLRVLDEKGKLVRVRRPVVRETELMPLYRLQFRGLPDEQRKAFLFENVVGINGDKFEGTMACGVYGASQDIFALGMGCRFNEVRDRWFDALNHPMEPQMVETGPVQEEIHLGTDLEKSCLEEILPPVEEPGFSSTLRTTTQVVTKDPETGVRNVGQYSGHFQNRNRIAWGIGHTHHGYVHWQKAKQRGIPLEAAIVVGATPNVTFAASAPIPFGVDEYSVAGGLAKEPVRLVKCRTIDLEVPDTAEIVIEGRFSTEYCEPKGSFGEWPGYMYEGTGDVAPIMEVTCITHRKRPIFTPLLVGMAPSDLNLVAETLKEATYYNFLKHNCNIPGVLDVAFPEPMASKTYCVIKIKKTHPSQPWQVLHCAAGYAADVGKIIIVVDEDVNPRDHSAVLWALGLATQPHRDIRILTGKSPGLDPSGSPPGSSAQERSFPSPHGTSAVLIDATRKWPYPPVGLPAKEYMERAIKIWQEENLPSLNLREPWYGYSLGNWSPEQQENASLVARGEYEKVGEKMASKRIKV